MSPAAMSPWPARSRPLNFIVNERIRPCFFRAMNIGERRLCVNPGAQCPLFRCLLFTFFSLGKMNKPLQTLSLYFL